MTRIATATITFVDIPIKRPALHSGGVMASSRRGIIKLTTEDGLVGLGEVSPRVTPAVARAVLDGLPGMSAFDVTRLRLHLAAGKFPVQAMAVFFAGLEMALLDIQGKVAGRPVCDLLGGAMRTEVPLIAYIHRSPTVASEAERPMREFVEEVIEEYGFQTIKLKAGGVSPELDITAAESVREAFPANPLRIDPSGAWSVATTMRLSPRLMALGLEWLEDPVLTTRAMHHVRSRTGIPLATNMCVTTPWDLPQAVAEVPVDVVLLDMWYLGGLRGSFEFQSALDAFKFGVGIHSGGGSAALGIGQAAALHLAAALPSLAFAADSLYHHLLDDIIVGGKLPICEGSMTVPSEPGLGVELDEDKLGKYVSLEEAPAFASMRKRDPLHHPPLVYPRY